MTIPTGHCVVDRRMLEAAEQAEAPVIVEGMEIVNGKSGVPVVIIVATGAVAGLLKQQLIDAGIMERVV